MPEQIQPHPGSDERMRPEPDYGETSYRGSGRLTGRVALVTGGDSGVGRAVAFAREGADVAFCHLPEEQDDAGVTARLVEQAGQRALPVAGDLRSEDFCTGLPGLCFTRLGALDILVNNAAYQMSQPDGIAAISTEQFDRVMRTNLYGMFWCWRARDRRSRRPRPCRCSARRPAPRSPRPGGGGRDGGGPLRGCLRGAREGGPQAGGAGEGEE
ncbi:short subunit dehydrogenase [Streptomyces sp. TLI_235]|nr:short subunit dehydrogenase [Streptomyces sp. TLI_235]